MSLRSAKVFAFLVAFALATVVAHYVITNVNFEQPHVRISREVREQGWTVISESPLIARRCDGTTLYRMEGYRDSIIRFDNAPECAPGTPETKP